MGKQGTQFFQVYACTKRTWLYVNSDIKEELFFFVFCFVYVILTWKAYRFILFIHKRKTTLIPI